MKRFYKILVSAIIALVGFSASAQAQSTCLTLNFTDGTAVKVALADKPEMTFGETNLTVNYTGGSFEYNRSDIANFNFTPGQTTAIAAVTTDSDLAVDFTNSAAITLVGKKVKSATLYNLAGAKVATATTADGFVTIDLSSVPSGAYIVEIPGYSSIKIKK